MLKLEDKHQLMGNASQRFQLGDARLRERIPETGSPTLHRVAPLGSRSVARRPAAGRSVRAPAPSATERIPEFDDLGEGFGADAASWRSLNEALEAEAKRIAHALHDEAGQLLTMVHLKLADAARQVPAGCRPCLEEVTALLYQIETQLRQISHELCPVMLEDLGLTAAIDFLAKGVSGRTGLAIRFDSSIDDRFAAATEATLYRTVQEALTNISRHAHATAVTIRLYRSGDEVCCVVRDNGVGFDSISPTRGGLGLRGIRERIEALLGSFRIQSGPGQGTELVATVPAL